MDLDFCDGFEKETPISLFKAKLHMTDLDIWRLSREGQSSFYSWIKTVWPYLLIL